MLTTQNRPTVAKNTILNAEAARQPTKIDRCFSCTQPHVDRNAHPDFDDAVWFFTTLSIPNAVTVRIHIHSDTTCVTERRDCLLTIEATTGPLT